METISRELLTFLLNSLWQIPLIAGVAALACRLMRNGPATHRQAVWVAALAAAVLLPLGSTRREEPTASVWLDPSLIMDAAPSSQPATHALLPAALAAKPAPAPITISLAETTAAILIAAYVLFVLFRLARLAVAASRTVALRRAAHAAPFSEPLDRVWNRCQAAFGLTDGELLFSDEITGAVTAGRTIILSEALRGELSEEVLTTAIGHEMAHIARRDFAHNLLYEVLRLPVSYHPATWLIRRGIEGAREMACDEMVAGRLIEAGAYARSIVSIAAGMMPPPRLGHSLSVLDGNNLEERIRRLVERPVANLKRARLCLATGLAALAICAVVASSLALTARAQDGASDLMKNGAAAYNRGDYREAVSQFQIVVGLEPANLKAKLSLAHALLAQYVPGTDPANPVVPLAQQQYRDVLAIDPQNRAALHGMMLLAANTKQFADAHDWALKAIQADVTDKIAYYTAGFLDWSMTYPDYAAARRAAGMKPADPGNIPDASLRQSLREKHGAQIEDGFRMLQIALQIDPGYSDAMAYMNLLYRIQAGIADTPEQATTDIAQANDWVDKAVAAKRSAAQNAASAQKSLDADGLGPGTFVAAPPPPPPPPPPPSGSHNEPLAQNALVFQGPLRVGPRVQAAKLISNQPPPVYPPAARAAGIWGNVVMDVTIAKDGSVASVTVLSGDAMLAQAAVEAVRQWKYQPTLLNEQPIEVITEVTANFTLEQ
jgi:TonB family protein